MAFNAQNFGVVSTAGNFGVQTLQSGALQGAPAFFTYQSNTETLATIVAANYFSPICNSLSLDAIIFIIGSDQAGPYEVSSIDYDTGAVSLSPTSITGDITGPASSTDTAVVRWSGTTGRVIEDSGVLIDGSNNIVIPGTLMLGGSIFTMGGNVTFSGAHTFTGTVTADTSVTFPTSGTLATTSQIPSLPLSGANGGTGVANTGKTMTIGGNFAMSGAFTFTGTVSGNTAVTFPTSGTLATTSQIPTLPLTVANGGTGDSSLTAYAVLCGGTTSTGVVQSIASVGTAGQVLTSNGPGALPTMQTPAASGGLVKITTLTASNSASLELTGLDSSTYSAYYLVFTGIFPGTTNVNLQMQFGDNLGAYTYSANYMNSLLNEAGTASNDCAGNSSPAHVVTNVKTDDPNWAPLGFMTLTGFNDSTLAMAASGSFEHYDGSHRVKTDFMASSYESAVNYNRVKFSFSSGNIASGNIVVYGYLR